MEEEKKERKKPGPKKGSKCPNPNGRPVGSKNKLPAMGKKLMDEWLQDNFDTFKEDFKELDAEQRAKIYVDVWKKRTPSAVDEDSIPGEGFKNELVKRLFGQNKQED